MGTAVIGAPEFRARNGIVVRPNANGGIEVGKPGYRDYTPPEASFALEEFFQAKRDAELGRWRWPENPDYVVYRRGDGLLALNEQSGNTKFHDIRTNRSGTWTNGSILYEAIRAYFEAHPERKPWHEAKAGETWRLTVTDRDPADLDLTFNVIGVENVIGARFARPQVSGEQMEYPITSEAIVAGRRIWPQDAS